MDLTELLPRATDGHTRMQGEKEARQYHLDPGLGPNPVCGH